MLQVKMAIFFLQKVWLYIKKYWQIILVITLGIIGLIVFKIDHDRLLQQIMDIQKNHDEEIEKINAARDEEKRQHAANVKRLQDAMDTIQRQYDEAKRVLEEEKKKQIKDIVTQYGNDPVGLSEKLSEVTGFKVILPEDSNENS